MRNIWERNLNLAAQAVAPEPSASVTRSPRARRPARQRNTTNSTVYRERYGRGEHALLKEEMIMTIWGIGGD